MTDTLLRDIPTEMKGDVLEIYRRGLAKTSVLGLEMLKSAGSGVPPSPPLLQPLYVVPVSGPFKVDMTKAKQKAHLSRYLVDAWGEDKVEEEMYSHEGAENHYCTGSKPHNFFRYRQYQGANTVILRLAKVADIVTEARRTKWPEIDRSFFILYQNPRNRQKLSDICKAVRQCGKRGSRSMGDSNVDRTTL